MKIKNSFHSYLSDTQYRNLTTVFQDLSNCINGNWILTGSLSYGFYFDVSYPSKLRDIDIVLKALTGANPRAIVLPTVKQKFYVLFIEEAVLGYYFGLRHKETGLWIDLFTPIHQPEFKKFKFENLKIKVQTPEESFYTMIKALLHRKNNKLVVADKWLQNAKLLIKDIDTQKAHNIIEINMEEYAHLLPKDITKTPESIVSYALNSAVGSDYRATSSKYPKRSVVTKNGISIEQKEIWLKVV